MTVACDTQMRSHFAPTHELTKWSLTFHDSSKKFKIIVVDEDKDVPDALAYHDYVNGKPVGIVLAKTIKDYLQGIDWKFGPRGVSVALSHEYLELRRDEYCNETWAAPDGWVYWAEVCDAVQDYSYPVGGVYVSDFVTKAWYAAQAPGPYDYLGHLSRPFQVGQGGYQVRYRPGAEVQVNGEKPPYHGWRSLSRTDT